MSLVKCKECGHQVSNLAKTCPSCGVKDPGTNMLLVAIVTIAVFALLGLVATYL